MPPRRRPINMQNVSKKTKIAEPILIQDKKPIVVYTIADRNNFTYALKMIKSLRYFHDWPVILYTNETDPEKLKLLPKNVTCEDLNRYLTDPAFFYRATPILSEPLLDQYECVLKIDADSIIVGDLSYVLETKDYDVGTVINWNRFDVQFFPMVELLRIGIAPVEYFNCGFVALRSKKFAHHWMVTCFREQFDRLQYKEQDLLNILCYFGNYNVRCFDHPDVLAKKKNIAWWGLIAKGELTRAIVKDKKVTVPKGLGETPFPPEDEEIKVLHMAGGAGTNKDSWGLICSEDLMKWIQEVTK